MMKIDIRHKAFPAQENGRVRCVFADFRLSLAPGEVCAITGPSGVGKSTLLQIVAGLDRDFEGMIEGVPAPIGYLFQTPRLLPWRTARENLELVLTDQQEAMRWLANVGLEDAADLYPSQLSIGMARRVALTRALAVEPRLLLLDEPFAALDTETARRMQRLVRDEAARLSATALIVTHSWHEASALAHRIVVLDGAPARIASDSPTLHKRAAE